MWFRLDLRLDDNPALLAAIHKSPVIPVFIWAPEEEEPWPPGAASRWWLHHSLKRLQEQLLSKGSRLILRRGRSLEVLEGLIAETGAKSVFWNRRYEPAVIARDTEIKKSLRDRGVSVETFNANLLFEPWSVQSKSSGRPFQVFSAFWKTCLRQPAPAVAQVAPKQIPAPDVLPKSDDLADLHLDPAHSWSSGLKTAWTPGEAGGNEALGSFLKSRLGVYVTER